MQEYKFTVPGRPVPAVRMTQREVRAAKLALKGRWPDSKSLTDKINAIHRYWNYKETVAWVARSAGVKMLKGRASISVTAYVCGGTVGDWDNYGKSVSDALKGIAWKDDNGRYLKGGPAEVEFCDTKAEERTEIVVREA